MNPTDFDTPALSQVTFYHIFMCDRNIFPALHRAVWKCDICGSLCSKEEPVSLLPVCPAEQALPPAVISLPPTGGVIVLRRVLTSYSLSVSDAPVSPSLIWRLFRPKDSAPPEVLVARGTQPAKRCESISDVFY